MVLYFIGKRKQRKKTVIFGSQIHNFRISDPTFPLPTATLPTHYLTCLGLLLGAFSLSRCLRGSLERARGLGNKGPGGFFLVSTGSSSNPDLPNRILFKSGSSKPYLLQIRILFHFLRYNPVLGGNATLFLNPFISLALSHLALCDNLSTTISFVLSN